MLLKNKKSLSFDGVNAGLVRKNSIGTKGSHELSKLDPNFWSKIVCNSTFGSASNDLCHAIALLARMLWSEELVDRKASKDYLHIS